MKIAQMCLTRAWGGLEMCAVQYAKLVEQRNFTSYAILMEGSPALQNIGLPSERVLTLPGSGYFNPISSHKIHRFLMRNKIDALFVHHLKDLWLSYTATKVYSPVQVIGFSHMFLRGVNKKDLLHSMVYSELKNLVVLTEVQKRASLECLPVPEEKYVTIPNGVDTKKFHPSKRSADTRRNLFGVSHSTPLSTHSENLLSDNETTSSSNETVIGMVGRLDPQKGQWEFLQAAAILAKDFPSARFVCVGQPNKDADGAAYKKKLEDGIAQFGLSDRFFLLGHHSDVSALTASIDIFAVPSYEETFGLCTIEAMASGCAVVGTNAGGTPELIDDEVTGLLFAPHSVDDLVRVLRIYLNNPALARQHGLAARNRVEKLFDINVVMDRILNLVKV